MFSGPGLRWQEVKGQADQLSTSPCGAIVWRILNNSLYVATKVSVRSPAGTKWVEAARDVACISLDKTVGWYVDDRLNSIYILQLTNATHFFTTSSGSLISLVVTKSHVCYQLGGAGWDWVRIPPGLNSVAVPVVYLTMLSL